jgi:hypothetical protein
MMAWQEFPGVLRLHLESEDGKIHLSGSLDAGHPHAGKIRQASFLLPKNSDGLKLKIRAEIETKGVRRAVKLGHSATNECGWFDKLPVVTS